MSSFNMPPPPIPSTARDESEIEILRTDGLPCRSWANEDPAVKVKSVYAEGPSLAVVLNMPFPAIPPPPPASSDDMDIDIPTDSLSLFDWLDEDSYVRMRSLCTVKDRLRAMIHDQSKDAGMIRTCWPFSWNIRQEVPFHEPPKTMELEMKIPSVLILEKLLAAQKQLGPWFLPGIKTVREGDIKDDEAWWAARRAKQKPPEKTTRREAVRITLKAMLL